MNDEKKAQSQLEEALQLCKDFKELDFKELLKESPQGGNNYELLD